MGLGAPKRREKLSHDPNNTAWSKSTDNYGHRLLSQQGWTPGSYLGAENASHSDHYTAANASHIRIALREDNLGLGAKLGGKSNAETFGLSTLSGIFGRLNGKSEAEVERQQGAIRDAELRTWQAQKLGFVNFVSGGLLVGDKIEEVGMLEPGRETREAESTHREGGVGTQKRKADDSLKHSSDEMRIKRKSWAADGAEAHTRIVPGASLPAADEGRRRKRKESEHTSSVPQVSTPSAGTSDSVEADISTKRGTDDSQGSRDHDAEAVHAEKARLKLEKRARKEGLRKRKEERRLRKQSRSTGASTPTGGTGTDTPEGDTASGAASLPATAPTSMNGVGFAGSRHAVRQRYIQQKRMASLNPEALREILMLKVNG